MSREVQEEREGPPRYERLRHGVALVLAGGLFAAAFVYVAPTLGGFLGSAVAAGDSAEKPACVPVVLPAPKESELTLNVYNASDVPGLATSVAKQLKLRGFTVKAVGNDPAVAVVNGPAEIRYGSVGRDGAQVVAWQVKGAKMVRDFRTSATVDFVIGADFKTLLPTPPKPPPLPGSFKVNVYNTTFRTGLASSVAKELGRRGFRPAKVANDPLKSMVAGVGLVRYGEEGERAARVVAEHLPGVAMSRDARVGTTVDLVIGNAFADLLPVSAMPPPPEPTPTPTPMVTHPGC